MSNHLILLGALSLLLVGDVMAAEDHSQHRHEPGQGAQSDEPTESERAHVPPSPPQHVMGEMSQERMAELMQMEDDAAFGMVRFDQFEWRERDDAKAWDVQAWYGRDYDKLWLRTDGDSVAGEEAGRVELLWDRIVSRWWSMQAGLREDFGPGPSRTWATIGAQGLMPYFFDVEAALSVGEQGRTAARLSVGYDMLFTQRLILQPKIELDAYGKDDPQNGVGSGLSTLELGLRLRYELRREIAPYIGVHWERKFGDTADLARAAAHDESDASVVVGLRTWF